MSFRVAGDEGSHDLTGDGICLAILVRLPNKECDKGFSVYVESGKRLLQLCEWHQYPLPVITGLSDGLHSDQIRWSRGTLPSCPVV